jgi:hypothetical protein
MKSISILNADKEMRISLSVHGELEEGVAAMNAASNTKPQGCGES